MLEDDHSDSARRCASLGRNDARAHSTLRAVRASIRQRPLRAGLAHDLMFFIVSHHDAGWAEFDRDPVTDERTGLPYNLVETPVEYITITSRAVARFQRAAPPLLRADIEHAQLGPLQRALRAVEHGVDQQYPAAG